MRKRILIDFTSTQAVSYRMGSVEIFHKKMLSFLFLFNSAPLGVECFKGAAGCVKTRTCFLLLKS